MIARVLRWPMPRVAIVLGVALLLGAAIVHADVPTTADMAACEASYLR